MGDGDQAVAGERVGKLEAVAEFSRGIGDERGRPSGAGIEVFPQEIGEFAEVATATDEESLVGERLFFRVFGYEGLEGRAGFHVEIAGRVKVVHGLRRLVAHDGERAFVFGVKGDLGAGGGLAVGEGDAAGQRDFVAGAVGWRGCFEFHGERVTEVFHDEFAVAEAELGFLEFAGGFLRALDDEDGDEGVRRVVGSERNFDDRHVGLELDGEGAEDLFALHGDEGGAFDRREDEHARGLAGLVGFRFGDHFHAQAVFVEPWEFMGSIDIEIGDGGEGAAVRVGAAEGEEMAAVGLGRDG